MDLLNTILKDSQHKIVYTYIEKPGKIESGCAIKNLPIRDEIKKVLEKRGITKLYKFQEEAIKSILKGENVFISAGTGTGKTEAFLIPLIEKILEEPYQGVQALLIYPTKALARDQFKRINNFLSSFFGLRAAIYDGDTPEKERKRIYNFPPQILITNPDMVHVSLLFSPEFRKLLSPLKIVVLDDMHVYSGVFGIHVAYIIRRLKRAISHKVQFIGTSATLENPEEFAREIFGESVKVIQAPRGRKGKLIHVLIRPIERSKRMEAIVLLRRCLESNLKTLLFADSHRTAEFLKLLADRYKLKVELHRAGIPPEVRRRIEEGLKSGKIRAVIATPTLELGIDIGDLDSIILYSIPPTFSKYIQRTGRAGRRGQTAYIFTILGDDPISSYYERNPEEFFKQRVDPIVLNLDNDEIAKIHLLAMSVETPLAVDKLNEFEKEVVKALEKEGLVRIRRYVTPTIKGRRVLRKRISIRGIGDIVKIITRTGRTIGFREMPMALRELHPGAIYLHGGTPYLSLKLEKNRAIVAMLPRGYNLVTYPLYYTLPHEIKLLDKHQAYGLPLEYLDLSLNEVVYGYVVKRFPSMETLEEKILDREFSYSFKTKGLLIRFPTQSEWNELENAEAFHAIEHAMITAAQLVTGAAASDIGGVSFPSGHIYIYDAYPGGSGVSKAIVRKIDEVLRKAYDIVSNCKCADGCPKCIYSPYCGNNNKILSRIKAKLVLEDILERKVKVEVMPRFGKPVV
ncbi:MAG: hypothetical protein DRJ38_06720 [Thermoprotei archaeon]|nr:MAG: hypothetical protein DRJ38_06720 [Thermoprotei archaeon]